MQEYLQRGNYHAHGRGAFRTKCQASKMEPFVRMTNILAKISILGVDYMEIYFIYFIYLLQLYLKLVYKPSLSLIKTNSQKLQNARIM